MGKCRWRLERTGTGRPAENGGEYGRYHSKVDYKVSYFLCKGVRLQNAVRPEWCGANVKSRWWHLCVNKMA